MQQQQPASHCQRPFYASTPTSPTSTHASTTCARGDYWVLDLVSGSLTQLGWQIDELAYQSVPPDAPGAVAQSVLEHLVAPGSVSELA